MFLLAKDWQGQDPTGWWMSEKLDGVRARWTGSQFLSRNGKVFSHPDWWAKDFPDFPLDGELYVGEGRFQQTVSAVRKKVPVDHEWRKVYYHVFDTPDLPLPWEDRLSLLQNSLISPIIYRAIVVTQHRCTGPDHLHSFHQAIINRSGEGVMLRQPGSYYEPKRSSTLLKVKEWQEGKAIVRSYLPGEGKHEGRMGALSVDWMFREDVNNSQDYTREVTIGGGFNDEQRENPPPIGTTVRFKYFGVTDSGQPRFPIFLEEIS